MADALNAEPEVIDRLRLIASMRRQLDRWEEHQLDYGREIGISWAMLGAPLGVSGQAIQQRARRRAAAAR